MSSSIWTRCAGDSELRPLRLSPWRIVEAQHQVSTRKLVDTLETWHCTSTRDRVELLKRDYFKPSTFTFLREEFLIDRVLPAPAP